MRKPFGGEITEFYKTKAPKYIRDAIENAEKNDILNHEYPYSDRLKRKKYEAEYDLLQIELVKLQNWVRDSGQKIVMVFEGRDAAGKGGTIKRMRENMNPRYARNVALSKPSERERGKWYFQRYISHLPTSGEIVFLDRSWYNRAGVEPVMGFCTDKQRAQFFNQCSDFESMLSESGTTLIKFWLNVGRAEQLRRFLARESDPLKQWKLSPIDLASLSKWNEYTDARNLMFDKTHNATTPWTVVRSDCKRRARLAAIRHLLEQFDYDGKINMGANDQKICGSPADVLGLDD